MYKVRVLFCVLLYTYIINSVYAQWITETENVNVTSISVNNRSPVLFTWDGIYNQTILYGDTPYNVRVCVIDSFDLDIFCAAITSECKCVIRKPIITNYSPAQLLPVIDNYSGGCVDIILNSVNITQPEVGITLEWRLEITDYIPPSVIYSVAGSTDFHIYQLYNMIRNNIRCHSSYIRQNKLTQTILLYNNNIQDNTSYSDKHAEYVGISLCIFIIYIITIGSFHF